MAEAVKEKVAASGVFSDPVVTEIAPATTFYSAEDYHQDSYIKNPASYNPIA